MGRPCTGLSIPEGGPIIKRGLFTRACIDKAWCNNVYLEESMFVWNIRNSSLWGQQGTGTGYSESLQMLHPQKCSRPDWMRLWAAWSSGRHPCPQQGTGTVWSLRLHPANSSVILRKNSMYSRYEYKIKAIFLCYTDISIFLIRIGDILFISAFQFIFFFNAGIRRNGFFFSVMQCNRSLETFLLY